jgi:hypothetical protein
MSMAWAGGTSGRSAGEVVAKPHTASTAEKPVADDGKGSYGVRPLIQTPYYYYYVYI